MIIFCDMIDGKENLTKFQRIYEKYKKTMFLVAYDISKNEHDSEDIVQIALIKLIEILYKIDAEDIDKPRCKNLMITITKNAAIDFCRKSGHEAVPFESLDNYQLGSSAEDVYIETEDYRNLISCIDSLEDKYKDVLRLRILHNLTSKETAKILNTNEFNVNTRFMRAKKLLAQKLKECKKK